MRDSGALMGKRCLDNLSACRSNVDEFKSVSVYVKSCDCSALGSEGGNKCHYRIEMMCVLAQMVYEDVPGTGGERNAPAYLEWRVSECGCVVASPCA
jgi:hypothetical protein